MKMIRIKIYYLNLTGLVMLDNIKIPVGIVNTLEKINLKLFFSNHRLSNEKGIEII
jgi:hypothetical protein